MLSLLSAVFDSAIKVVMLIVIVIIALVIAEKIIVAIHNAKKKKQEKQIEQRIEQEVERRIMETRNEYLVMPRNVIQTASAEGQLVAGRYILVSGESGQTSFNVRLNGLVREYNDGDIVALADNDTICPVSGTVLIKPYIE